MMFNPVSHSLVDVLPGVIVKLAVASVCFATWRWRTSEFTLSCCRLDCWTSALVIMPEETNLVYKASSTTKLAKQTNVVKVLLMDWFFKVDIKVKQLCIGTKVAQAMRDWALEDSRRSICNHQNVLGGAKLSQNVVANHKRKGFTGRLKTGELLLWRKLYHKAFSSGCMA
jgi:hypothetical protein